MHSRRKFLESSLALAGTALLSPAMLASCSLAGGGEATEMDYIGNGKGFERYREYLKRTGVKGLNLISFEQSLDDETSRVVLDISSLTKPAYILMLLEQDKDILTPYPLGFKLSDYTNISEFMEKSGRFVGIMDPLAFYPSMEALREIMDHEGRYLRHVSIRCHPVNLVEGFPVAGLTGPAQNLERAVSRAVKVYPLAYHAESDAEGALSRIRISYADFPADIDLDPGLSGWGMTFEGGDFRAELDHTGLLALEGEVEPRHAPEPNAFIKSIRSCIRDFLSATKERSEPLVNHLDGLASIILNNAVKESLESGRTVRG